MIVLLSLIFCLNSRITLSSSLNLTILHVNDVHSHFEEVNVNTGTCKDDVKLRGECYGGVSRMVTYIRQARHSDPETLLLNGGDFYQGTMWYTVFKYQPVVEFSNVLNYTAGSLGNHDWDDGGEGLQPFVNGVNFPVLAANLVSSVVRKVRRSVVVRVRGELVGIIGYVTPETLTISNPGQGNMFRDVISSVEEEAKRLKSIGVNILIAVGHAGYSVDKELARRVAELDIVVGGHSHTFLYTGRPPSVEVAEGEYPTYVVQESGRVVPVVQAYCYTKYIGHLQLQFDSGGELVLPVAGGGVVIARPVLLDHSVQQDSDVERKLWKYQQILQPYRETLGFTLTPLVRVDEQENLLGNLVADSMLAAWEDVQIAFINDGGLRSGLERGEITGEDVLSVLPFNNTVDKIRIRGSDLLYVLEWNVAGLCPEQTCETVEFYQMSGLRVSFEVKRDNVGERVVLAEVREEDGTYSGLVEEQYYWVAIVSFLTLPGKSPIGDLLVESVVGDTDYDVLVRYIKANSPIRESLEGRINVKYFA